MISAESYRLPLRTLRAVATGEVAGPDLALLASAQRSRLLPALAAAQDRTGPSEPAARPPAGAPATRPAAAWAQLAAVQRGSFRGARRRQDAGSP
ncbi:hypothetical protein ABZ543_19130 [Streptomyces roseifaciens]